ncbi:MAG TPA: hypothetical protein VF043_04780 [Ktedonobacteraceae bacterium]
MLLLELDQWLDKRLIRTFVQTIEAILTFRDRINGLVLSELGSSRDPIGKGGGTKRLSRLLHSPKWTAALIERFLWWRASQQSEQWDARRCHWISAWVLAFPVRHPDLPLWLVVARRKGSTPDICSRVSQWKAKSKPGRWC